MPIASAAIAVAGLGVSVYKTVDSQKKAKEAEKQAAEYKRQELKNPYENLQVSTMGADLQQQNLNNQVASAVDTLQSGGSRSVIGGIPSLYNNIIQSNQQIAAGLDQQYNNNQQLKAQGEAMVQNMTEQRERDDLLGIGNAANTYRQEAANGVSNIVQSGLATASALSSPYLNNSNTTNTNNSSNIKPVTAISTNQNGVVINSPQVNSSYGDQLMQYNKFRRF